jgi:hypothetical protein
MAGWGMGYANLDIRHIYWHQQSTLLEGPMNNRTSMPWRTVLASASLLVASTACHRVIIDSGLEPAPRVHHEEWNIAYAEAIYPAQIDATDYCKRWARVETKQSFLNWVVGAATFGIITPMDVKVVCAESVSPDAEDSQGAEQPQAPDLPPQF